MIPTELAVKETERFFVDQVLAWLSKQLGISTCLKKCIQISGY